MSNIKKLAIIGAIAGVTIAVTLFVLAAYNAPTAGEVTDKDYRAGYSTTTIINNMPSVTYHPPRWTLEITGEQGDGEIGTWEYDVPEGLWARASIGDWYDADTMTLTAAEDIR